MHNKLNYNILKEINKILIDRDIQQKKLSIDLGISPAAISLILSGKNAMSLTTFFKICFSLNMEPSNILEISEKK